MTMTTTEMRSGGKLRRSPLENPPRASSGAEILRADAAEIASIVTQANKLWPGINATAEPFLAAGWSPERVRTQLWNAGVDLHGGEEIHSHIMPDAGLSNAGGGWDRAVDRVNSENGS